MKANFGQVKKSQELEQFSGKFHRLSAILLTNKCIFCDIKSTSVNISCIHFPLVSPIPAYINWTVGKTDTDNPAREENILSVSFFYLFSPFFKSIPPVSFSAL